MSGARKREREKKLLQRRAAKDAKAEMKRRERLAAASGTPQPVNRRPALPPSGDDEYPAWRVGSMDTGGTWSCHAMEAADLHAVTSKLAELERVTMTELWQMRGNKITDSEPHAEVRSRLNEIVPQLDEGIAEQPLLCEIHITGEKVLHGWLLGNIIHILWWDPHHTVWPAPPRHT